MFTKLITIGLLAYYLFNQRLIVAPIINRQPKKLMIA